jgi:hypothetical protein
MASSRLIYATTTGTLTTVDFPGRPPHRPRNGGERRRRRRPLLAVPGLTGFRYPAPHHAPVAQGKEQLSPKQQVAGSSPARGTTIHPRRSAARKPHARGRHHRPRHCTALDDPNNALLPEYRLLVLGLHSSPASAQAEFGLREVAAPQTSFRSLRMGLACPLAVTALVDAPVPDGMWRRVEPLLPVPPRPPRSPAHHAAEGSTRFWR